MRMKKQVVALAILSTGAILIHANNGLQVMPMLGSDGETAFYIGANGNIWKTPDWAFQLNTGALFVNGFNYTKPIPQGEYIAPLLQQKLADKEIYLLGISSTPLGISKYFDASLGAGWAYEAVDFICKSPTNECESNSETDISPYIRFAVYKDINTSISIGLEELIVIQTDELEENSFQSYTGASIEYRF